MTPVERVGPIRVLHLEDSARDVQYIADLMEEQGLECAMTHTSLRAPFEDALRTQRFDLVICDFSLPDLNGLAALRLVQQLAPGTPVIIVSGAIDSTTAVACLREGATDLLLKDRLERLPSAVIRALDERARRVRLQEVEARFQQMADQSPAGFWFIEPDPERVVYASRTAALHWGVSVEVLLRDQRAFLTMVHPEEQAEVERAWDRWVRGLDAAFDREIRVMHPDGTVGRVQHTGTRVVDGDGVVRQLSGITQDVTARHAMEARMQHAQKMEVVGRLSGGIAHDFNTLLTVINGTAEMALASLTPSDAVSADLHEIHAAGKRGAHLVAQLMAFSRQQILRPQVIDPAALLANLRSMLTRLIGTHIRFELLVASDDIRIRADVGQIEQVMVNLVVNARDAMVDGGTLTIALRRLVLEPTRARALGLPPGPYADITVRDTGRGMNEEVRQRAFEPFFTTRGSEGGTGLGLSTVYGITSQSGGTVILTSQPGAGTTFQVLLPDVVEPVEAIASPVRGVVVTGTETVLVVDDDPALRMLIQRMLSAVGYAVLVAENGPSALRVLADSARRVDLLITDMVMPEMGGQELSDRCRAVVPSLSVMYMSGYTEDEVTRRDLRGDHVSFLAKPFTVADLSRSVREALGRGR